MSLREHATLRRICDDNINLTCNSQFNTTSLFVLFARFVVLSVLNYKIKPESDLNNTKKFGFYPKSVDLFQQNLHEFDKILQKSYFINVLT